MWRAIDFARSIRDEDDALGREAALVARHAQGLAIGSLRLLDGHADGHTDVDVQLLAGGVLQVKERAFPGSLLRIQLLGMRQRLVHQLLLVHIHGGLEEEALGVDVVLSALIVHEVSVVRTAEGQLPLDALLRLGESLGVGIVHAANGLLATYLQHHLVYPGITDGLVILRERQGAYAPLVAATETIECYQMFHKFYQDIKQLILSRY